MNASWYPSLIFSTKHKYEMLSYWQYMETDQHSMLEMLFEAIDIQMMHVYCCDLEEWRELGNPAEEVLDLQPVYLQLANESSGC